MPDLFISYAREDRDTALALAHALQSRGIDVWWDRELTGGGDFAAEIERNLRAAPVAVVLWSAASVRSDFVRDESSRARDMGKLLPVRISPVELPLGFGTLHTLDLLDWDGDPADDACQALIAQVRQRLAAVGPRDPRAGEAQRLAQWASEDTLSHRRLRRRLLLAAGVAGAAGTAALGWIGWQRFNRGEALAHLAAGLEDHFATPPRLESAQSEYASAIELDGGLAPAHYDLGHLYAQLMLRGNPPPAAEVLDALRGDARLHFQRALDAADRLDSVQRVVARSQLALLSLADAAPALTRPATAVSMADSGNGSAGERPDAPSPPPAAASAGSAPELLRLRAPRVSAEPAVEQAARSRSEALFSADRDTRLAASTSLTLDPAGAAESLPSAIALARRALRSAPRADTTAQGVASALALLERASPATLRSQQDPLRALLAELAASPLGAAQQDSAARLTAALERNIGRRSVAYLQIARESQRPVAEALARRLAGAGYVTPGIELIGEARAPERPSLRVQGASDPELARWCQRALEEAAGAPVELVALRRAAPRTDTYELWFDKALCAPGGRNPGGCAA